ncbi:AAA family ATPase [Aliarcobacter butzleri]|uniref:AAA family ATPase n=1 Tax=Aliarcobacter butzleri TaxID=28197 RepID=UPI0021B222B7|nr:AAA family ATPase [Aliarcobacter butzleri]MCT7609750.1 AAA family ATPase [Aliarcobacter butzleri]
MKINKIYIKNFKGIKNKQIVDFSEHTTFLTGPNGFGKTTIYDVIELCLTGKIHRTNIKKDVTSDRKDYVKPYYQNDISKEVLIKLWLQNGEKNLIIAKYLNDNVYARPEVEGKKNKPTDFDSLETFKHNNIESFEDENFDISHYTKLEQNEITDFFELKFEKGKKGEEYKIDDVYMLFNYLQQEETTYFLKQKENDRKNNLGFLFQTNEQEEKLKNISAHFQKFDSIQKKLELKIAQLKNENNLSISYKRLFEKQEIDFDVDKLFLDISEEEALQKKEQYIKDIDSLIEFIENFSPTEYKKRKVSEKINNQLKEETFTQYQILNTFLEKEEFDKTKNIYDIFSNSNLLYCYILQQFLPKYLDMKTKNENLTNFENYTKIEDYDKKLESLKTIVSIWDKTKITFYEQTIKARESLISGVDTVEKILNEIIKARNALNKEFEKSPKNDNHCPYCGYDWKTAKDLEENFKERENTLKKLLNVQSSELLEMDKKINDDFIDPINKYIEEYQKKNQKIDENFLSLLDKLKDNEVLFDESIFSFLDSYIWKDIKSIEELDKTLASLKEEIKNQTNISYEIFEILQKIKTISFQTQIDLLNELKLDDEFKKLIIKPDEKNITKDLLQRKQKDLFEFLDNKLLDYKYDDIKSEDKNNYFEKYFESSKDIFEKYKKQDFIDKKSYINTQFQIKQNEIAHQFEIRKGKIDKIVEKLKNLKDIYSDEIKAYKVNMTEKIKIPFFIYTAKILQNYQQGMGIFINTNVKTSAIRFLTPTDSDHDVMHHLSSGQLAVVSLAFCLAINKTYNISPNLKILAIDDPIQEMDALNIHSFIELIKNEFAKDYQLIFSTHNDMNAIYMKYKIENFYEKSVKVINVQKEFFGV